MNPLAPMVAGTNHHRTAEFSLRFLRLGPWLRLSRAPGLLFL